MTVVMGTPSPRDRTVRSAALLFRERGVAGTGLREIVDHAQAPRGSLQHYFPGGKQELVVEAMAWIAERAARPLREALLAEPAPPARVAVAELLARFRELLTMTEFRGGCPIAAGVADASWDSSVVADAAQEAFNTWLTPLEQVLRRGGLSVQRSPVLKNNQLIADAARHRHLASPLLDVCHALFGDTVARGHGQSDMVAILAPSSPEPTRTGPPAGMNLRACPEKAPMAQQTWSPPSPAALRCQRGWSMIDQRYSMAARCPRCDQRAILTLGAVNCLVSASRHRLASFRCPEQCGWHVRYPGIEGGGKAHRRGWR